MTQAEFERICTNAFDEYTSAVPYTPYSGAGKYHSTGNMRYKAFKIDFVGNECRIYIDKKIADYVIYTNKYHNVGWWDRLAMGIFNSIQARLQGELKKL